MSQPIGDTVMSRTAMAVPLVVITFCRATRTGHANARTRPGDLRPACLMTTWRVSGQHHQVIPV